MLDFFGSAARKLTSFPFIATLAVIAIALTQLEPLQDAKPGEFFIYLLTSFGALFLLVVFHFATKTPSVYIRAPAVVLIFVVSACFAYIVVAITSRSFGGPWQPCIMVLDGDCRIPYSSPEVSKVKSQADSISSPSQSSNSDMLEDIPDESRGSPQPAEPSDMIKAGSGTPSQPHPNTEDRLRNGRLQLADGWIYEGLIKDGQPVERIVTLVRRAFPSGREEYEGAIKNGKPHGNGKISGYYAYGWPQKRVGFSKVGQFQHGVLSEGRAQSMFIYEKGTISSTGVKTSGEYTGSILGGEPHGDGIYKTYEGNTFYGNFNSGYFDGCMERNMTNGEFNRFRYQMGRFSGDC